VTSARTYVEATPDVNIVDFDYEYASNTNNIAKMTYGHRPGYPCTDFTYDNIDRLKFADYGIDDSNEIFTIDDVGNRSSVNVKDESDVNYVVDKAT